MGGRKRLTAEDAEAQLLAGEWLTPGAVAALLGVDRGTVNYWLARGQTPSGLRLRHRPNPFNRYRECDPSDVRAILAAARRESAES